MKKLLTDSLVLAKQIALLQASREVYVVLAAAKLGAFAAGVVAASILL
jgi:hypothetical protein